MSDVEVKCRYYCWKGNPSYGFTSYIYYVYHLYAKYVCDFLLLILLLVY